MTRPSAPATFTVVICSYDRRESLSRTLDTLADQRCERPFDVLVIDNNSSDGTAEMVESRVGSFPTRLAVVREQRQGISHARNLALELAKSDVLVFVDDDVDCPPDFVAAWMRCFEDERVDAAGGRILPLLPDGVEGWLRNELATQMGGPTSRYDFGEQPAEITGAPPPLLPFGANMAIRRELASQLGGFRTKLGWGSAGAGLVPGEETLLMQRVLERRGHIVYWPAASVVHRILPERVTVDYLERWYEGFGRAGVISSDPSAWQRVRIGADALVDLVRTAVEIPASRQPSARLAAIRRRAKARGRLAQLLGR